MHPLYRPAINRAVRTLLQPFSQALPERWQFPVTGVVTVHVDGGRTLKLACNPTSYLAKVLYWQGYRGFEHHLVRVFADLVQDARVFFDVGANIGYYSLLAALFNPDARIYSFEPLPSAFHYLQKNLVLNGCGRATPVEGALSDEVGTARFFAARNPKFLNIAYPLTSTGSLDRDQAARSDVVEEFEVQVDTMDHFVQKHGIERVDLVKLDTEATEHLVLAGAAHVLREHRPVVLCEVLPGRIEQKLEAIFSEHDYRLYRAEAQGLVPVRRLAHGPGVSNDHVMVPVEGHPIIERFQGS